MSTEPSSRAPAADPLGRLARAVAAGADPEPVLAELGVAREHHEGFARDARALLRRARARVPAADDTETQLALGVLLVLCQSPSAQTPFAGSPRTGDR